MNLVYTPAYQTRNYLIFRHLIPNYLIYHLLPNPTDRAYTPAYQSHDYFTYLHRYPASDDINIYIYHHPAAI